MIDIDARIVSNADLLKQLEEAAEQGHTLRITLRSGRAVIAMPYSSRGAHDAYGERISPYDASVGPLSTFRK